MNFSNLVLVGILMLGMLMIDITSPDTDRRGTGNPPERMTGSIGKAILNIDEEMKMRTGLKDPAVSTSIIGNGQVGKTMMAKRKREKGVSIENMIFELLLSIRAAGLPLLPASAGKW